MPNCCKAGPVEHRATDPPKRLPLFSLSTSGNAQ
jgi:hypothetical protein